MHNSIIICSCYCRLFSFSCPFCFDFIIPLSYFQSLFIDLLPFQSFCYEYLFVLAPVYFHNFDNMAKLSETKICFPRKKIHFNPFISVPSSMTKDLNYNSTRFLLFVLLFSSLVCSFEGFYVCVKFGSGKTRKKNL